jgi:hypothetical protein
VTTFLERAQVARAVKARVLLAGADTPAARRDIPATSVNGEGIAADVKAAPEPGTRLPAGRLEPAT